MADQVTIKPETNKVELTDQRRNITVTDNRTGASINLTQTDPAVLLVNTPRPTRIRRYCYNIRFIFRIISR
jgi:hypothetical protein